MNWAELRHLALPPAGSPGFSWAPYLPHLNTYLELGRWDVIEAMLASSEQDVLEPLSQSNVFIDKAPEPLLSAVFSKKPQRFHLFFKRKDLSEVFWKMMIEAESVGHINIIKLFWEAAQEDCNNAAMALKPKAIPLFRAVIGGWMKSAT